MGLCPGTGTCPGGDHETCPMHHGGSPDRSDRVCAMTNCSAPVDVALLSMAGGAGVLPSAFSVAQPQFSSRLVLPPQAIVHAPIAHDTPPPRR